MTTKRSVARLLTRASRAWRSAALTCAVLVIASASIAEAGVKVWTSSGPEDGLITALAIESLAPSTLYAGTGDGGIFKSTDAGASWEAASTGLNSSSITALAIDPHTPSTLYAGGSTDILDGVFKSTDAGATWEAAGRLLSSSGFPGVYITALAIDPLTPSTLYAGACLYFFAVDGPPCHACAGSDVFKSTDAGATWGDATQGSGPAGCIALAIDPVTPRTMYAGGRGGAFKSTDAGATWEAANAGLTDTDTYVRALAIDPRTPGTLYAGTAFNLASEGVFKSTDAGATWAAASAGLPSETAVSALAIDPLTPSTLYAGTDDGVFESTDAGATWESAGLTSPTGVLAIDPLTPSTLYAGTYGGGVFSIQQIPPTPAPTSISTPSMTASRTPTLTSTSIPTSTATLPASTSTPSTTAAPLAPTPASTSTPSAMAAPPLTTADGGGCAIAPSAGPDAMGKTIALLLAPLVLFGGRHRSDRKRKPSAEPA